MSVAGDFATKGAALLERVGKLAKGNRGAFSGGAASVLALTLAYAEAARNAFRVLAADETAAPERRQAAMAVATTFGQSAGTLASSFGRLTDFDLSALKGDNPAPLSAAFAPGNTGLLVSPLAREAIEVLRGDPLELAQQGTAGIEMLMGVVLEGVELRA